MGVCIWCALHLTVHTRPRTSSVLGKNGHLQSSKTPRMPLYAPVHNKHFSRLLQISEEMSAPDRDRTYDLTVTTDAVTAVRSNQLSYKSMPAFEGIRCTARQPRGSS